MRPASIIQFERLYILKIVIGLIVGAWTFMTMSSIFVPAGAPPAVQAWIPYTMIGSVAFQLLISLLLLYFIARRGSEIAKWIFVILFALGAAGTLRGYLAPGHHFVLPVLLKAVGLLELVIEVAMVVMLFRPDAKAWFADRQRLRR